MGAWCFQDQGNSIQAAVIHQAAECFQAHISFSFGILQEMFEQDVVLEEDLCSHVGQPCC